MRRERGGLAPDLRHAAVAGEHARARVVENEGDVVGLQHEIDRHHDRAEPHQRVSQRHEAVRIAGENRDLVAAPDPARGEARGQSFARRREARHRSSASPRRRGRAGPERAPRCAARCRSASAVADWRPSFPSLCGRPLSRRARFGANLGRRRGLCKSGAHAAASARRSPSGSALIARRSVRAGPLGRLAPRSHSCTVRMLNL